MVIAVWSRKHDQRPADLGAAIRVETVFTGMPVTGQQLADRLEQAGEQVTDASVAGLRRRAGPWLPAPRSEPYRSVFRRRDAYQHAALRAVVGQAETVRNALNIAGQARSAAYAAQGYTPEQTVSLSGSDDPPAEAAAIDTALWARQTTGQNVMSTQKGQEMAAIETWQQRQREAQRQIATLHQTVSDLPRRDRTAARMVDTWLDVALDRIYYTYDDRDIVALEETSRQLLTAVPEYRCPRSAPRRLARHHRDWEKWATEQHSGEITHLVRVSQELTRLHRAEGRIR